MKKTRPFIWLCLGAVVLLAITVLASQKVPPPDRSKVVGAWAGYSDGSEFLRLELDEDGTGYVCISFVLDKPPKLYQIQSWHYSDWKLEHVAHPIDTKAEAVTFTNIMCGYEYMECQFGGDGGWKRKAKLFSEREWKAHVMPLQERIAGYRKEKR